MDPGAIQDALQDSEYDAVTIAERLHAARALALEMETQQNGNLRQNIPRMVQRVEIQRLS